MFVTKLRHIFGMLVSYINIGLGIVSASRISYIYVCNVSHIQLKTLACICTVKCRYNAVQFITVLQTELRKHWQKVGALWGAYCDDFGDNWPRDNGTSLYAMLHHIPCLSYLYYNDVPREINIFKKRIITWRSVTFCGAENISLYISSCIYVAMYVVPFRNPLYFIS